MAEQFEVSKRTAHTDRSYLAERLGAPIQLDRSRGGWFYSNSSFVLPFLAMSDGEAVSLARCLMAAMEYLGPADANAVKRIVAKLQESSPQVRPSAHESIGGAIRAMPDVSVSADLLSACKTAIERRQRREILYFSAHRAETSERIVQPVHLHNHQGEWHLIAWCEWRKDIRQFFLGRVSDYRLLPGEGAYTADPSFDIAQYLAQGFGMRHGEEMVDIELLFSARQARWIRERIYHPSQKTSEHQDGRLGVTMRVAGTAEIMRWILSYGAEVEVVAPELLRLQVADAAKKIREIYLGERD